MRYSLILMDADDTIFDFQAGNRRAVGMLMDELGLSSPTVFEEYQQINHACWQALERGEMDQETLHVERFRRFLRLKGRTDDPKRVADRFAGLLGQQAIPLPHAEETVERLAREREIVILTNGITPIQKSRMARSPVRNWISRMVISQEVGTSKPDPRIFEIAMGDTPREKVLMIGDGLQSDVRGANNAGMDVCWFNPLKKPLPNDLHTEYEIHDIRDCLPIALS